MEVHRRLGEGIRVCGGLCMRVLKWRRLSIRRGDVGGERAARRLFWKSELLGWEAQRELFLKPL